jgi:hypothetical protein
LGDRADSPGGINRAGWPCPMVKASFHGLQLSSKARCKGGTLVVLCTSRVAAMMDSWKRGFRTRHTPGAYPTAIRPCLVSDRGRHFGVPSFNVLAGGPRQLSRALAEGRDRCGCPRAVGRWRVFRSPCKCEGRNEARGKEVGTPFFLEVVHDMRSLRRASIRFHEQRLHR